jgi:CRISPR-associated protein Cas8a1/Csx13
MGQVNIGPLVVGLNSTGLTPLQRAGLGGLAASLFAISQNKNQKHDWPRKILLGPGSASVEADKIFLDWGAGGPGPVLQVLFEASFKIRDGLVYLPGMFRPGGWSLALGSALQRALKLTFLQNAKSTRKDGSPRIVTVEPDTDIKVDFTIQPYEWFAHQSAWEDVEKSFKKKTKLAGWANPGAVDRHNAFPPTKLVYGPEQILPTLFAIVGCLPFQVTGDAAAGALVIPEPADLIEFGEIRASLTPGLAREVYAAGTSDAVLLASLSWKAARSNLTGIQALHGVSFRSTPWASQQKIRVSTVRLLDPADAGYRKILVQYERVCSKLKTRVIVRKPPETTGKKTGKSKSAGVSESSGYFAEASVLRGFIAENLAAGKPWYHGFATARVGLKRPRYVHFYRKEDNKGALVPSEKEGLWIMIETAEQREKLLIESVHTALRRRFGAICKEADELPEQTRENRFKSERERWRLAFAKAKTPDQVRAALANLWSRAGLVKELQENWQVILPLLHSSQWATARDLALVALASYRGKGVEDETSNEETTDENIGT